MRHRSQSGFTAGRHLVAAWIVGTMIVASTLGCGYALVGRASNIPDDVQAIYLAPLENLTPRVEVEQFLTQAIADELVTRNRFDLLNSASGADATLEGAVTSFSVTPVTFDADGRAEEYEISIIVRMAFTRTGEDGEVLWKNDRYLFRENYELEASEVSFFDRENLALEESSGRFAESVVADLLEGF